MAVFAAASHSPQSLPWNWCWSEWSWTPGWPRSRLQTDNQTRPLISWMSRPPNTMAKGETSHSCSCWNLHYQCIRTNLNQYSTFFSTWCTHGRPTCPWDIWTHPCHSPALLQSWCWWFWRCSPSCLQYLLWPNGRDRLPTSGYDRPSMYSYERGRRSHVPPLQTRLKLKCVLTT